VDESGQSGRVGELYEPYDLHPGAIVDAAPAARRLAERPGINL
jgi:hypothetical protein